MADGPENRIGGQTADEKRGSNCDSLHMSPNAAVQRPRDAVGSAARAHNEMERSRRRRDAVSRSAATACYARPCHVSGFLRAWKTARMTTLVDSIRKNTE